MKRRVIDSVGCAVAAFAAARAAAAELGRKPASTIIGSGARTSVDLAAMANGVAVRYLDYNDTYLSLEPAHPSDNIPAAFAVAEAEGRDGRDLITALSSLTRFSAAWPTPPASGPAAGITSPTARFPRPWRQANIIGLSPEQLAQAVNLAGVASPALRQTRAGELSMGRSARPSSPRRGSTTLRFRPSSDGSGWSRTPR